VYFGDTVTCHFTIVSVDEKGRARAEAEYRNQNGTTVMEAVITGMLPNEKERDILAHLI
jgi:acyl dehydratase